MIEKKYSELVNIVLDLLHSENDERSSYYDDFNIFTLTKRDRYEESTHCRFIFELLSPDGSHRKGDLFLRLFFEHVLGLPYPEIIPKVYRELTVDTESRIDLCIVGEDFCYPIEVKIDAGERPSQLERYYNWATANSSHAFVYFLTLDGHAAQSAANVEESVILVSFEDHIMKWISACCQAISSIPQLFEPIHQYYVLLQRITGRKSNMIIDQAQKEIDASAEMFEVAQVIADALDNSKVKMIRRVMQDIEDHLNWLQPVLHKNYDTQARNYYRSDPCHIGVSFTLRSQEQFHLAFRVQIDNVLYVGLALYKGNGRVPASDESNLIESIHELTPAYHSGRSKWFYWWKPLLYQEEQINFRSCAGCYKKLYDADEYEHIIRDLLSQIDSILNEINIVK